MTKKAELTRARITEAAITCMATIGIERTSVTEIAQKAEVSRGLVAHYFPKKDEIFEKLIQYIAEKGYVYIQARTEGKDGLEALLAYYDANMDFFFDHANYFKTFSLLYYFSGIDEKWRATNTTLTATAYLRIQGWLGPLKLKKAERERRATEIHDGLVRVIQKYYSVNHGLSKEQFKKVVFQQLSSTISG